MAAILVAEQHHSHIMLGVSTHIVALYIYIGLRPNRAELILPLHSSSLHFVTALNLISVNQLTDNILTVTFISSACSVQDLLIGGFEHSIGLATFTI